MATNLEKIITRIIIIKIVTVTITEILAALENQTTEALKVMDTDKIPKDLQKVMDMDMMIITDMVMMTIMKDMDMMTIMEDMDMKIITDQVKYTYAKNANERFYTKIATYEWPFSRTFKQHNKDQTYSKRCAILSGLLFTRSLFFV